MYRESSIQEITANIAALKELESQISKAIPDEQEAQRMYDKMASQSDKVASGINIQSHSSEIRKYTSEIRGIKDQEHTHENKFREMQRNINSLLMQEVNRKNVEERKLTEERRKKEDEDRRKREEEQRKPPLSEGYHGPYRLRR